MWEYLPEPHPPGQNQHPTAAQGLSYICTNLVSRTVRESTTESLYDCRNQGECLFTDEPERIEDTVTEQFLCITHNVHTYW